MIAELKLPAYDSLSRQDGTRFGRLNLDGTLASYKRDLHELETSANAEQRISQRCLRERHGGRPSQDETIVVR